MRINPNGSQQIGVVSSAVWSLGLFGLLMLATSATAQLISYSQWESSSQTFREAYIAGAFDTLTTVTVDQKSTDVANHYFECIKQSKMTGVQMAENVRVFGSTRSEYHAGSVQQVLLNYLISVCGRPSAQ
jgi:hypothetical protein